MLRNVTPQSMHTTVFITLSQAHIVSPTFNTFNLLEFPHLPFYSRINIQHSNHVPSINSLPRFRQDPCFWHLVSIFSTLSQVNWSDHLWTGPCQIYILYLQWYTFITRASRLYYASALRLFMIVSFQKWRSLLVINKSDFMKIMWLESPLLPNRSFNYFPYGLLHKQLFVYLG